MLRLVISPCIPYRVQAATLTPLLWDDAELADLLAGSPVLEEVSSRKAALKQQWQDLQDRVFSQDPVNFPPSKYQAVATPRCMPMLLIGLTPRPHANHT